MPVSQNQVTDALSPPQTKTTHAHRRILCLGVSKALIMPMTNVIYSRDLITKISSIPLLGLMLL